MHASPARPLRICVLGIRGIDNVQGGVETHAAELYPRLIPLGCEVIAIVRSPFSPKGVTRVGAVRVRRLWAPRAAGLEAFLHSLLGVLYAAWHRPDILHIHAIGPAIVTPIARMLGLRVVVTHHGPDYERDKWGRFARAVLRRGELWGMRYSHARIAISRVIQSLIRNRYSKDSVLIPNGVSPAPPTPNIAHIEAAGLVAGRYFLMVSRIVPEKRQLELIEAFRLAAIPGWKLALVGGLGDDAYARRVSAAAASLPAVVLTGFRTGEALRQIYAHAGAFILPSAHEGLPIALLEALSFGLPVVASDIPANLEIGLPAESYFPLDDVRTLAARLTKVATQEESAESREARTRWVAERYDWDRIARQTYEVYAAVAQPGAAPNTTP